MRLRSPLASLFLFIPLALLIACGGSSQSPTQPSINVSISPAAANLLVGSTAKFTASITGHSNPAVTYRVVQGAAGGDVLGTGDYVAPRVPGTYTVRASSVADPTRFADATVTVRDYGTTVTQSSQPADGYDYHTASLLPDGSVLIVGGTGATEPMHRASLRFIPSTNSYQADAPLQTARMGHVAFTLPGGKIIVAGGQDPTVPGSAFDPVFKSSEIYDPATKTFTAGPDMNFPRRHHVATPLPDGRVLITGGIQLRGTGFGASMNTEIYDPSANKFLAGNTMNEGRWLHTATLLQDGRVLIVGGRSTNCTGTCPNFALNSAEIFDPATGNFTPTGALNISRHSHTATLLSDGRVLVLGGETAEDLGTGDGRVGRAEVYDPATGKFTAWTQLVLPRSGHAATLLNNGKLWVTGGYRVTSIATDRTELFDPATGTSAEGPLMHEFHVRHTATHLPNGEILIFSGNNGGQPIAAAELLR